MGKTRSQSRRKDDSGGKILPQSKKITKKVKTDQLHDRRARAGKKGGRAKTTSQPPKQSHRRQVHSKESKSSSNEEAQEDTRGRTGVTGIKITRGSAMRGYNHDQYEKYKQLCEDLKQSTVKQLQEILKENDQTVTGTKVELITKVADGQVLGKIPRCPNCKKGRPKFDFRTGTYLCPGYRDEDGKQVVCRKKFTMKELPRRKWKQ